MYSSEYGSRDHCIIVFDVRSLTVRIAGITRYGTQACLKWVLNKRSWRGDPLTILLWKDSNGDSAVQIDELSVEEKRDPLKGSWISVEIEEG